MRTSLSILLVSTMLTGSALAQTVTGQVVVSGDSEYPDGGIVLRPSAQYPSVIARLGSTQGKLVVFSAANTSLLQVQDNGNVGIGVPQAQALLHLRRNGSAATNWLGPEILLENNANDIRDKWAITFSDNGALRAQIRTSLDPSSAGGIFSFATGVYTLQDRMTIGADGNTHIRGGGLPLKIESIVGTALPAAIEFQDMAHHAGIPNGIRMAMYGNSDIQINDLLLGKWSQPVISNVKGEDVLVQPRLNVKTIGGNADLAVTSGNAPGVHRSPMLKLARLDGAADPQRIVSYAFWVDPADNHLKLLHGTTDEVPRSVAPPNKPALLTIAPATATSAAQLIFEGAIVGAVYQDIAEWVPSQVDVPPGTVVILNPDANNQVMPSEREYDSRVAGVVSAQPGLILGAAGEGKEMVATTGRVRVKVDAVRSIRVGDLLVSSSKPGMAMRSEPIDLHGIGIHRPGTIIGKALEPLLSGEGEILVLLSLQ
jgi:hypothetical protein